MTRFLTTVLLLIALVPVAGATFSEDFSASPTQWEAHNAGAFRWDQEAGNLAVTWDSRETNAFYYHRLPFTLDRRDSFLVEFTLRLDDLQVGINPGKNSTFQICLGFLNVAQATRTNYFRGSGINAATGPRSVIEFSYFPDDGAIDATIAPIIASTNNQIAFSHSHPVDLMPGETFRVRMAFEAATQILSTSILHNGIPYGEPANNAIRDLPYTSNFGDFRIDAFSITTYSDAGQSPPQYAGSVLAHGIVDDVAITFPDPPIENLMLARQQSSTVITFAGREDWNYTLERTVDFASWEEITFKVGTNGAIELTDPTSSSENACYRVRADRL